MTDSLTRAALQHGCRRCPFDALIRAKATVVEAAAICEAVRKGARACVLERRWKGEAR